MNSYKVKGIILVVIIFLASIMMPFSVYADTITNSNVNINYYLDSVTEVSTGSYMQTYTVEFVFDKSYLGWISSKMVGTYVSNNTVPVTTSQFTKTQAIYVNGSIATTSFTFVTPNNMNGGALQSLSQSIQNSNVTPLADLSTLDDILNVLTDINNNIEIDVLSELQNIVANTSLANDYLDNISKLRQYNFPIESFLFVSSLIKNNNYEIEDFTEYNYYSYPIFKFQQNDYLIKDSYIGASPNSNTYIIVFAINKFIGDSVTRFNNYFSYDSDILDLNIVNISYFNDFGNDTPTYIMKCTFKYKRPSGGLNISIQYINSSDARLVPIYANYSSIKTVSTEFALQFGLTNTFLDNIQIIANGTTQSNSAASNLESSASDYSSIADDVVGVEEGLTNSFETSVNQISTNNGLNVFGGHFMTSATWVRTQFDRLTENTPYGSLVIYGLTLGFALLMLGKVFL